MLVGSDIKIEECIVLFYMVELDYVADRSIVGMGQIT